MLFSTDGITIEEKTREGRGLLPSRITIYPGCLSGGADSSGVSSLNWMTVRLGCPLELVGYTSDYAQIGSGATVSGIGLGLGLLLLLVWALIC